MADEPPLPGRGARRQPHGVEDAALLEELGAVQEVGEVALESFGALHTYVYM